MKENLKVYIADDSSEMIQRMKQILSKSDMYQVIGSAGNGEQCILELRCKHIDILILDLIMPKKDGIQVLKELKDNSIKADHIICTTPFINDVLVHEIQNEHVD